MASSWHNRHNGIRYAVLDVVTERGNKGFMVAVWDRRVGSYVLNGPAFVHMIDAHEHAQDLCDGFRTREAAVAEVEKHLAEAATRVDGVLSEPTGPDFPTGGVSAQW